jgi:hypothetical protein
VRSRCWPVCLPFPVANRFIVVVCARCWWRW